MIQTSEHEVFKRRIFGEDQAVVSVSESSVEEERALAQGPMASSLRNRGMPDDLLRAQLVQRNKDINAALNMINCWTLDSDSIIIQSTWYCWGICVCCAALVLGGFAIRLTVSSSSPYYYGSRQSAS